MDDLTSLIERVRSGSGADRELDIDVFTAAYPRAGERYYWGGERLNPPSRADSPWIRSTGPWRRAEGSRVGAVYPDL